MRISDWSSDVCSSDLEDSIFKIESSGLGWCLCFPTTDSRGLSDVADQYRSQAVQDASVPQWQVRRSLQREPEGQVVRADLHAGRKIGRASCRERVCRNV